MNRDDAQHEALAATATAPSTGSAPRASADAPLGVGDGIGRYTISGVLGHGGMGIVYAAYDPDLDRTVALKLLHNRPGGDGSATAELRARLLREARAIAKMSHPNVIAVYEVGTVDDTDFVAMEMVDGPNLSEWLGESHHWREVLRVMRRAGRGLVAAHKAGLVHRDFKPANVLLGKDGRVRVTDFGLARPVESMVGGRAAVATDAALTDTLASDGALTRTGAVVGTPAYMAPEQHQGKPTDERSDQFSFCVALYEGLYGERPFAGETVGEIREATLAGRVRAAPRGSSVPTWVRRALLRGLSVAPEDRFESVGALLAELGKDPTVRRNRILAAVAIVAVVAGAVGFGITRSGSGSQAGPCDDADTQLVGVWDEPVRQKIKKAFEMRNSAEVFRRFAGVLDDYAASWKRTYVTTCKATRVRREVSEDQYHLHMGCLLDRKRQLGSLATVFAEPGREGVDHAVQAAQSLPAVAPCGDLNVVRGGLKPPADKAKRAQVDALRGELAQVKALQEAARFPEAAARAAKALTAAQKIKHPPLLAEAMYRMGRIEYFVDRPANARMLLQEVAVLADAASYDEMRARALVALAQVSATYSSNGDETRRVARRAKAAIKRFGQDPDLDARLANALGMLLLSENDYGAALAQFEKAYAFYKRGRGDKHLLAARPLRMIAKVHLMQERPKKGLFFARQALDTLSLLGPDHHRVASARRLVAAALRGLMRYDEARAQDKLSLAFWASPRGQAHLRATGRLPDVPQPTRRVSGVVVGRDGKPVAGAEVAVGALLNGDGKYLLTDLGPDLELRFGVARAVTGTDGTFTVDKAQEGALLVSAEHGDHGRAIAKTIPVKGDVDAVKVRLMPYGRIRGKVVAPAELRTDLGVQVSPLRSDGTLETRQSANVVLADDGSFEFQRVPVGKHRLQFGQADHVAISFRTHEVTVTAGQTATVNLPYENTGVSVEIEVVDPSGAPIQSAQVFLFDSKVDVNNGLDLNRAVQAASGGAGAIHLAVTRERRIPVGPSGDPLANTGDGARAKIVRFQSVSPGKRSLCIVPLGGDLKDPAFKRKVTANVATLTVVCRRIEIPAKPARQVRVEQVTLMKPLK